MAEAEVFFLKPEDGQVSETLRDSFALLRENGMEAKWIDEKECLAVTRRVKRTTYVCDPFRGTAFDHLKELACRILGPLCISSSLQRNEHIPSLPYPIYNTTMKGLLVSCTNISIQYRHKLFDLVKLMSGEVSGTFTKEVTHLISDEVGSRKYLVAANCKVPVMLPEWVEKCWELGQTNHVSASDEIFSAYRCPVFKGLIVTVTQIDSNERKNIQKLIEENGGTYTGELRVNSTTHLVALKPKGQKYTFARQWKVPCVLPTWLQDSVRLGYAMDEALYKLDGAIQSSMKTSSPRKTIQNVEQLSTSSISVISPVSHVDDTVTDASFVLKPVGGDPNNSLISKKPTLLDRLEMKDVYRAGNFLDGCRILTSGFNNFEVEKLRRVINAGGGTRLNQLTDSVTHCIMKNRIDEIIEKIEAEKWQPRIVTVDWLIDSCHAGFQVDCRKYQLWNSASLAVNENVPTSNKTGIDEPTNGIEQKDDVMTQYLQLPSECMVEDDVLLQAVEEAEKMNQLENEKEMEEIVKLPEEDGNEKETSAAVEVLDDQVNDVSLLTGLIFAITGFDDEDRPLLEEMIKENGGYVINNCEDATVDYVIVPLVRNGTVFESNGQTATHYWLQMCLEKSEVLTLGDDDLFQPISVDLNAKPLTGHVITISQYFGVERDILIYLVEIAGAKHQEYFARKAVTKDNLRASTHLVCNEANGSKYQGAVKWGLPAINRDWLVDCARSGCYVEEKAYIVGETVPPTKTTSTSAMPREYESPTIARLDELAKSPLAADDNRTSQAKTAKSPAGIKKLGNKERSIESLRQMFTPGKPRVNRIKELMEEGNYKPDTPDSVGARTPSKFLGTNKKFVCNFKVSDSPAVERRESSPGLSVLDELLFTNLQAAKTKTKPLPASVIGSGADEKELLKPTQKIKKNVDAPLKGVILGVSKKLHAVQAELNNMVSSLGGDYRWIYDKSCTHFVHQGKLTDVLRELRMGAKDLSMKIVAPAWVEACFEQKSWVDESSFPAACKPNMSLNISISEDNSQSWNKQKKIDRRMNEKGCGDSGFQDSEWVKIKEVVDTKDKSLAITPSIVIREELNQQMEAMLTMKTGNGSKGRRKAMASPSSAMNTSFEEPISQLESESVQSENIKEHLPEPPQSIPITWDDPMQRVEMEKIAPHLSKESQFVLPLEEEISEVIAAEKTNDKSRKHDSDKENMRSSPDETIGPDGMNVDQTNDETYCTVPFREETFGSMVEDADKKPLPRIMLSGFNDPQDRIMYAALVESLGGKVMETGYFESNCTHLVLNQVGRNEKLLASIASGKWIVYKSYLEQCREEGRFVDEEMHEWGGIGTEYLVKKLPSHLQRSALSARRWRVRLQSDNKNTKAFSGWRPIVLTDSSRESSFRRLLEAGGAIMATTQYPFSEPGNATHAFLELTRARSRNVDFKALVESDIPCLKAEYIAAYLTDEPLPEFKDYYIPEVLKLMGDKNKRNTALVKRKSESDDSPKQSKRNRNDS